MPRGLKPSEFAKILAIIAYTYEQTMGLKAIAVGMNRNGTAGERFGVFVLNPPGFIKSNSFPAVWRGKKLSSEIGNAGCDSGRFVRWNRANGDREHGEIAIIAFVCFWLRQLVLKMLFAGYVGFRPYDLLHGFFGSDPWSPRGGKAVANVHGKFKIQSLRLAKRMTDHVPPIRCQLFDGGVPKL